jgi:hypothetical protein
MEGIWKNYGQESLGRDNYQDKGRERWAREIKLLPAVTAS